MDRGLLKSKPINRIKNNDGKATVFFTKEQLSGASVYVFYVMVATIMAVFINPSLQIITGPILAICFTYLYFKGHKALVTAIIVVANDALRCIFLGRISFIYLLLGLLAVSAVLRWKNNKNFKLRYSQAIAFVICVVMLVTLYYYDIVDTKNIIYTLTCILAFGMCVSDEKERANFFKGVAISVFLISIHACITGGVEFYELNQNSTQFLRKGILGVGIGDSNMSGLLLNVGAACALFDVNFRWYTKLAMVAASLGAMAITLSTSALLGFLMVLIGFAFLNKKSKSKKLWTAVLILFLIVAISSVYMSLPRSSRIPEIDAYIDRMEEKLDFLADGNISDFTTNRSDIADRKMDYFLNGQGPMGILFGMNSLYVVKKEVPHNTYIDLLLQIGLIGTLIALSYMAYSLFKAWKKRDNGILPVVLKIIFLFYFLNLSLFQGPLFALAYLCVIII